MTYTKRQRAAALAKRFARGTHLPERHEQWVGLSYIEQHGMPGHPPAQMRHPIWIEEWRDTRRSSAFKAGEA